MADKLHELSEGAVTYTVKTNGSQIEDVIVIKAINVYKAVNKISTAYIELYDGGKSDSDKFDASASGKFDPGAEIEILAGYASTEETIFKGIITKQGLKVNSKGEFLLNIECRDEAIKMTIGRKNNLYSEMSDSDIITQILGDHGLSSDVGSTSYKYPELIQNYCSDWDFVMQRAELNSLVALVDDGKVTVKKPESGTAKTVLSPGTGLLTFNAFVDAKNQLSKIKGASWDPDTQEVITAESGAAPSYPGGSLDLKKLADVIGLDTFNLQSTSQLSNEILTEWTSAKHLKASFSKIQGNVSIIGYPVIKPGDFVTFEEMSDQFNGDVYVSGVEHSITSSGFTTVLELGLDPEWYTAKNRDMIAPNASGIAPPMKGLYIGVVEQIHEDPDSKNRVKVKLPTLNVDNLAVWARLSNFYSTADSGAFFYPEVGDEVVVGFLNEDPQSPIILGSMYNGKSAPAYTPDADNFNKAIVTKAGSTIHFDEENKIITINTVGENKVVLDDKDAQIYLEDSNGNKIEMTADGITITSAKDIILDATGDLKVSAGGVAEVKATQDFKAEGMTVALKASTEFKAEGAMAELKGSGQTTISGGIVMIN